MLRKIFISLCLSVFGLIVGIALLEIGFRLVKNKLAQQADWSDRPPFYFQHELSPNLIDYRYDRVKPPNTFRISIVGDSYSFAPFMQFTDAFPKVLERMLNLNDTHLKAEVINFGVPGYSTSHEIEEVQKAVSMQTDLIVLQITLNDPELKPYRPTGIREFGRFGGFQPQGFEAKLYSLFTLLGFARERLHNNNTRSEYIKYFNDLFSNPRSRASFEDSVKQIVRISRRSKTPLVAAIFPLFGVELNEAYPFHNLHLQVTELMQSHKVPYLDLFQLYKGIPLERLQVIPGIDRHPNEIAHRMAAEEIYRFLSGQNLIPEEIKIRRRYTGRTQIVKETPFED